MGSTKIPWICTATNRVVNPTLPAKEDIDIQDIARSLSNLCRFTGHLPRGTFYSVAQHSVLASLLVDARYQKEALLHDAAEAYINDVNTPVKSVLKGDYGKMEEELERAIAQRFGLIYPFPPQVKEADEKMFRMEVIRFYDYNTPLWTKYVQDHEEYQAAPIKIIRGLGPVEAEQVFLQRYGELFELPLLCGKTQRHPAEGPPQENDDGGAGGDDE